MLIPKTLRDIQAPKDRRGNPSRQGMNRSAFVVSEIRSPQDVKIDRQLKSIFNRLNQSYSTSINTPHSTFLRQQIDDFLQISQTAILFNPAERLDDHTQETSAPAEVQEDEAADELLETIIPIHYR